MVSDGYTGEDHEGWGVPALCVGQGSDKGLCMNCLSPKKKNWCLLCEIDFIRRACVITITYVTYVALAKNLHVGGGAFALFPPPLDTPLVVSHVIVLRLVYVQTAVILRAAFI